MATGFKDAWRFTQIFGYWRTVKVMATVLRTMRPTSAHPYEFTVEREKADAYRILHLPADWTYSDEALKILARQPDLPLMDAWDATNFLYTLHHHPDELYELERECERLKTRNSGVTPYRPPDAQ